MNQLKTRLTDLQTIVEHDLTLRHLAERFMTFDVATPVAEVRAFMVSRDFDVVGVTDRDNDVGYVERAALQGGALADHLRQYPISSLAGQSASMPAGLRMIAACERVFVVDAGSIAGIVTKGDLQKAPMRMWLFAVLSLLEMQLLRIIELAYSEDSWRAELPPARLQAAEKLLAARQRAGVSLGILDCLQFADKGRLVTKHRGLLVALGFRSRAKADKTLTQLRELRDELAHAHGILARWPLLVSQVHAAVDMLARAELLQPDHEVFVASASPARPAALGGRGRRVRAQRA